MSPQLSHAVLLALGLGSIAGCSCGPCLHVEPNDSPVQPLDSEAPDSEPEDSEPPDGDGDGYAGADDCDDTDANIHPGATEVCDGVDNDCDGDVDEGLTQTVYADVDGDGFGDDEVTEEACEPDSGQVGRGGDCDDNDASIHPEAPESCDGVDNDCDGEVDEDLGDTWYEDFDGDGYGAPGTGIVVCDACLSGYVHDDNDCDDRDPSVSPGADEVCDGADNDCDGDVDEGCFAQNRSAARQRLASSGVLPPDVARRLGS